MVEERTVVAVGVGHEEKEEELVDVHSMEPAKKKKKKKHSKSSSTYGGSLFMTCTSYRDRGSCRGGGGSGGC